MADCNQAQRARLENDRPLHLARRRILTLMLCLAAIVALGAAAAWTSRHRGVTMTSFSGADYTSPTREAIVADVALAPGDPARATRWAGYLEVSDSDDYDFWVEGSGDYRLFVNDIPVVDAWDAYGRGAIKGRALLSRGLHKLRVEHRAPNGGGQLIASWACSRFARRPLAAALRH